MSVSTLPVELILEIASYLAFENQSRSCFALTCRHTFDILLPAILERQRKYIQRLHLASSNNGSNFGLYGIDGSDASVEPFGNAYRELHYRPSGDIWELLCAQGIITRAKELESVHLYIGHPIKLCQLATIINKCIGRPNLSITLSGTLLTERKGPFRYEQIGATNAHSPKSYSPTRNDSPPSLARQTSMNFSRLSRRISSFFASNQLQWISRIRQNTETENISYQPRPSSQPLTTTVNHHNLIAIPRPRVVYFPLAPEPQASSISIESDTFFTPSFYPYTMELLNTAPLKKLSLSNLTLTLFDWAEILASLTMPLLTELCIGNIAIAFPDLLLFLKRRCHQSIEILDFTDNDPIGRVELSPVSILSRLKYLAGSLEYIIPFLENRNRGNFPSLQEIEITGSKPPPTTEQINRVNQMVKSGQASGSITITHKISRHGPRVAIS